MTIKKYNFFVKFIKSNIHTKTIDTLHNCSVTNNFVEISLQ